MINAPSCRSFIVRTAQRYIVKLLVVHQLQIEHKLGSDAGNQFACKHGCSGVGGHSGIVFLVHFGIDVRIVGHLCGHVSAEEELQDLKRQQAGGPDEHAPYYHTRSSNCDDQRLVSET